MNLLFMANNGLPRNGLVALYDMGKQIALGNTGQTLVDFSGCGNSAQLGSTAGADTNDPAYSGQGLTFGTDDYCKSSSPVFDDMSAFTCITVCKPLSAGGGGFGMIFNKSSGTRMLYMTSQDNFRFAQSMVSGGGIWDFTTITSMLNTNIVIGFAFNKSKEIKMYNNANKVAVTILNAGVGDFVTDANDDLYIGNRSTADLNFDGPIYLQAWYNRILSDTEYMQAYNYLRRLMMSRGVSIG